MDTLLPNFKLLRCQCTGRSRVIRLLLGLLFLNTALPAAAAIETARSNAVLRVAYVVPSNRVPQAHAVATLRNTVLLYQNWFADQMKRSGFGGKTFSFESEADGFTPFIHVISVPQSDEFLRGDIYGGRVLDAAREAGLSVGSAGELWWLIPETHFQFPDGSISGSFELGTFSPAAPMQSGWAISGSQNLALYQSAYHTSALPYESSIVPEIGPYPLVQDVSFSWSEGTTFSAISSSALGGGLRSLGEAFGLNPDYRNDENFNGNLMGFGFRGIRGTFYPKEYPYNYCSLSYASALALNGSPFFNAGRLATDTNAPTINVATAGERATVNGSLQITFQAGDDGTLQAALLKWGEEPESTVAEEMILSGTNVTRTFVTPYFTPKETNYYTVTVFDTAGNRRSAQTVIYPQATGNRAPQPFIVVSPLVSGPGQDIVLDASGTFDPEHSADVLEVEWDLDGDGIFDTFPTSELVYTNSYFSLGTHLIRARISDPAGAEAVSAPVAVSITVCPATLSPLTRFHGFGGSTGVIEVTVGPKCNWAVVNTNDWVTIVSGATGVGNGRVIYNVQPNPFFADRQGTLFIGDEYFLVKQHAIECTFSLTPTNRFHGFGAASNTFKVTTKSGCAWQVVNTNSWIVITNGTSGVGTGTVSYIIAANRVADRRSGNVVVGDEIFTVNQWGTNCDLVLNVASRTHTANSETGTVSVSTANGCAWEVDNTNAWISFTAVRSTNTGSLTYIVPANPNLSSRVGIVLVNGQPFTITQQGCSYSVSPTNRSHPYLAQTGLVAMTSASVCPWMVINTNGWITILSGISGAGTGEVAYAVSQNPSGNPRTGSISVAGFNFAVFQSGKPCSYTIAPEEAAYGENGGGGELFVTTQAGCPWSAESPAPWIRITSGATGDGPGRVTYLVSANTGPERYSTLRIGGQDYSISQASGLRTITAGSMAVASGRTNCLPITLAARGGENSLAFSVCFDTNLLIFRKAQLQTGLLAGATLTVNSNQSAQGRVGITVALPAGTAMTPGAQAIIQVCLSARSVTGRVEAAIALCDSPVARRLSDTSGRALSATFAGGTVQVIGTCSLAEALDAPQLNWTSSSISWGCQADVTHDTQDAAVCGVVPDGDDSYMETTITGPGLLSFWWKVSSEPDNDRLRLYLDGSSQFQISGEVDWEWRQLSISSGSHVLRWRYSKSSSTAAGADRGWVDQVSFEPAPPSITGQPANRTVDEGATATFNITASGQAPLSYQWLRNGVALSDGNGIRGARTSSLTVSNAQPAQAGLYSVIVGNPGGNVASAAASLSIIPAVLLPEALDAPNLAWSTNGTIGWLGQAGLAHDGADAARSGTITHSQTSSFQTTVNGPGALSFWWKVSSEEDNDEVIFYINGSEQTRISGEVDWQQQTFSIGSGTQTLRWTYSKDSSTSSGQDRAWVDQFEFAPTPVVITSQPVNQTLDPGATAIFAVSVSGAPPFTYQWQLNGTNLLDSALVRGATNATLTVSNVQAAHAGLYSVHVRNPSGDALSSNALLQVNQLVALPDALDAASLVWTTNGTPPWVGQTSVTHDGADAARSGRIGDSQTNVFQTIVTGPGSISFWWKVSCETNNDRLRFYINGSEQQSISGEVDWTWRTFTIGSGSQVLEWRYTKNSSAFAGQDRAWVDEIYFVPANTPTPPVISIQPTNRIVVAPAVATFSAIAVGSAPLNYQWLFNDIPLNDGNGINGTTTTNLVIATTGAAHSGNYSLLVTNIAGSITSSVATLTVITSPLIVTQPVSSSVLAGSTANFNVTALGTAPLSYQWLFNGTNLINGGNISGTASNTLRVSAVTTANAGNYSVMITNAAGAVTSVVATLIVSTPPSITSQPGNRTLPAGSTTSFAIAAAGTGPLSFQWRRDGANLGDGNSVAGSTAATLWLSNVQASAAGNYSVVVRNPVGQIVSANAVLTVLLPPVITTQPLGQSVAEGGAATLNVVATGAAPLAYQWRCNGTNLLNGQGLFGATSATLTLSNAQPSQSGLYSVQVSNSGGSVFSVDAPLTVIPKITLGEALNAPYLEWKTKTNAPWTTQTNISHDGEAAAQSGIIASSNSTWIETTVTGPGTVRFWWKVSSQTNADTLNFALNGTEWSRISGNVDWQKMSFDVPPGPLTLRWTYAKDAAFTSGFDRAWLDEVDFLPNNSPSVPVIVSHPESEDLDAGGTATFAVEALGTGPLIYQWRFEGQNLSDDVNVLGATSPTLRLFNVQAPQAGLYDVVVHNAYSQEISEPAFLDVFTTIPLSVALDTEATNLLWRIGGYSSWLGQTRVSSDSFDAAQSSPVANRATNWLETVLPGPCALAFWWKVSSETNHDRLRFLVNGVEKANISGETPWRQRAFPIDTAGARVRWEYTKDATNSAGQDRAWLDRIEMLAVSPLVTNAAPNTNIVEQGTTVRFKVDASGTLPLTYQWKYAGTNLLESVKVIGATTSHRIILSNAQPNQTGFYSCVVGNEAGADTSEQMYLRVSAVAPIGPALNTKLVWETGGFSWFVGTGDDSHSDGQSARNGYVDDGFSTWMRTTVNGPGTVTFWWRASTQPNADFLNFYINGLLQGRISGNVSWQQKSFAVPDGLSVLQWEYAKDLFLTNGLDRVFVDEVVFTPAPPFFTNQPITQAADAGENVTFTAGARGGPPLTYRWHYNFAPLTDGGNITGAGTPTLRITGVQPSQSGSYFLRATNVSGIATSPSASLTVTPILPLADALDTINIVWSTTSPGWIGQPLVTHDGVDAARSPTLSALQASPVQATITGPALVSFWWKVSSETNADYMAFGVDGTEQARISGEVNWHQRSFEVPAGKHTVSWVYAKDGSGGSGQDRGWVDQFVITSTAPVITLQPLSQIVDQGSRVTFSASASGLQPLTYQWRFNGVDVANGPGVSGARSTTLVLSNAQPAQSGTYSLLVSNSAATTVSAGATLTVVPVIQLAVALDNSTVPWRTNGASSWLGQTSVSHDGVDAARSGAIGNSTTTWMETTVNGPGTANFWWKISSEPANDWLAFSIDGTEQARISGEVNWTLRSFNISSGSHVLRWTYSKNGSVAAGDDRAWVDEVQFGTLPSTITTQPTNRLVNPGNTATFTVAAAGTAPLTYRWRFNGAPLANSGGISGVTTPTLTVANVQTAQLGNYSVIVSNLAGTALSANATLAFVPTLNDSLDGGLTFTTDGTALPWTAQRAVTHDGSDAVQTGTTTADSTYTWIKTTVTGPGTLTFWWKVSSEADHDFLRLMLDGVDQTRISGEVDWQQVTFNVPSGSHELQWRYSRSPSGVGGLDRGWLDQVFFVRGGVPAPIQPLKILIQPISQKVDEGETVNLGVVAIASDPPEYQWFFNANTISDTASIGGTTTAELTAFNVHPTQSGNYFVVLSNTDGAVTSSVARLEVNRIVALGEAVDAPELFFMTEGDKLWEGHEVVTHDGMDAARSGLVNDGQRSSMQTMVDGPGTLSFWWKVSSETNSDILTLSLNGQLQASISGEVDWEEKSIELLPGPQFIEWTYLKNDSVAVGADRGWIDQLLFVPFGMLPAKAQPMAAIAPRISIVENRAVLTWEARARRSYEVLYKDNLSDTEWKPCDTEVLSKWTIVNGLVRPETYTAIAEEILTAQTRFYRVSEY